MNKYSVENTLFPLASTYVWINSSGEGLNFPTLGTNNICITWEFVRNAYSLAPFCTSWIRNSGCWAQWSVFYQNLHVILTHNTWSTNSKVWRKLEIEFRETILWWAKVSVRGHRLENSVFSEHIFWTKNYAVALGRQKQQRECLCSYRADGLE